MRIILPKMNPLLQWGIILMVIKVSFDSSNILPYSELVDTLLALAAAGIFAVEIIRQKYSKKMIIVYGIIGGLALYCMWVTGNFGFLITILLCMAMRTVNFDTVIKHIWVYELFFLLAHLLYAFVCWGAWGIPLYKKYYGEVRWHFGFTHPNMFSMYLFNLMLMWVWLNYQKIKRNHVAVMAVLAAMVSVFTRTRTSLLNTWFLCLLLLVVQKESRRKMVSLCAKWVMPVFSVVLVTLSIFFSENNRISQLADRILNSRVRLGGYAYANSGLTLFGQDLSSMEVVWDPLYKITEHTFDSVYTSLAMNYGCIWLIILSLIFYKLVKKEESRIHICLIMWAMYGVTEVHGLNGFLCFPVLLTVLLYEGKKEEKSSDERKSIMEGNYSHSKC